MKATEAKLLEFLKKAAQFVIPIYQRTYSWGEKECQQLWDDVIRAGKNDKVPAHFVGSIVYVEKGLYQVSSQSPLLVIDGQQRLTTVTLLIEALARKLGSTELLEGFSAKVEGIMRATHASFASEQSAVIEEGNQYESRPKLRGISPKY